MTNTCHRIVIALAVIVVAAAWEAVVAKGNTSTVATTPKPTPRI